MKADRWHRSKNPIRVIAGRVRYRTGLWVEDYIDDRPDRKQWTNKKHKIRRAIWEYGIDAEGDSNCIEYPLLGKIIKWERRKMKTMKKWHKLHTSAKTNAEKAVVAKLWKKMKHEEAMMDKWLKFEDERYVTRAEEREYQKEQIEYYKEHGEFPKTPPLIHGTNRMTQDEWDEVQAKRNEKKPPIAL